MVKQRGQGTQALAVGVAASVLFGCGSGVDNAGPRVSAIPSQSVASGTAVVLDLAGTTSPYVTDREGDPLTFSVVSGGGSFTGSVYSHTFETLGTYTVDFAVSDLGQQTLGSFDVTVSTANFALVSVGDNLALLDTDTRAFVNVTGAAGFTDTVVATLAGGQVVYERTAGSRHLFVFDPLTRETFSLSDANEYHAQYLAHTDEFVLFQRTSVANSSDTDLLLWGIQTAMLRDIATETGVREANAMLDSEGNVYYERGTPSDIYMFDPDTLSSELIAEGDTAETLRAVLSNDNVVFTRIGDGGESDLFHYDASLGTSEVGLDLGSTVGTQSKRFGGATSTGVLVFEVTATTTDLYVWDPSNGQSAAIAASGTADEAFAAVTGQDEVVFTIVATATPSNVDLSAYDVAGASTRVVSADAASDDYAGQLSNGDVLFFRGADAWLFDTSAGTTALLSSAGAFTLEALLDNDDIVLSSTTGVVVLITPSPLAVTAFNGAIYQGTASDEGDFVVLTATGLTLWDSSAGATVAVSTGASDAFGAASATGDLLYSSTTSGKTTADLFLWDPSTTTATQLTDGSDDYGVSGTLSANSVR